MLNYIWFNFGLNRFTQFDLIVLVSALYAACAITGAVIDLVLSDSAFGAVINGVLIFIFMLTAIVIYNETVQMIRYVREPLFVFGMAFGAACSTLLLLAIIKNRLARDD